jgi:glycosyltransferase involved in cell wall biosynthesis
MKSRQVAEQRLSILQVNTFDIGGGSARVAWDLFAAYRARGHASWLAVGRKRSNDPHVFLLHDAQSRGLWFRAWLAVELRLERRQVGQRGYRQLGALGYLAHLLAEPTRLLDYSRGLEDLHHSATRRLLSLPAQRPSIIHGHNLHGGYFDLRALEWLSREAPVLLTLHDAWLLSGHCAHSFGCERWRTGCGQCPDLTIYPAIRRDATAHNWQRKHSIFANSQLAIATPSQWLMRKVEQSMLAPLVADARVVPNGVDLSAFHPGDMHAARRVLGIPENAFVLLFAAESIRNNRWKDYRTLRDAVAVVAERLDPRHVVFIALGANEAAESIGRAEGRFVAYQHETRLVALYYQAADVYVHAAREDTFPNSVLEAMACGTPVVATAVGGIPEQVDDGRTGFLVGAGAVAELAARLTHVLSDADLRGRLGREALESAQKRFDLQQQVDTYLGWYAELCQRRQRTRAQSGAASG